MAHPAQLRRHRPTGVFGVPEVPVAAAAPSSAAWLSQPTCVSVSGCRFSISVAVDRWSSASSESPAGCFWPLRINGNLLEDARGSSARHQRCHYSGKSSVREPPHIYHLKCSLSIRRPMSGTSKPCSVMVKAGQDVPGYAEKCDCNPGFHPGPCNTTRLVDRIAIDGFLQGLPVPGPDRISGLCSIPGPVQ